MSVILDAWSRRVIGWALDRSLASRLAITALEHAIDERQPPPGVVHHSDQGVQYDCHDYVSILKTRKMTPSMSRPANPYDNATCESFMRTLKREEIHCREYRDLEDLDSHLANFWIALQENFSDREAVFISRVSPEGFTPSIRVHPCESVAQSAFVEMQLGTRARA